MIIMLAAVRKNNIAIAKRSDLGSDVIIRSFTYPITQKPLRKILNELPLLWAIYFHPKYKTKRPKERRCHYRILP